MAHAVCLLHSGSTAPFVVGYRAPCASPVLSDACCRGKFPNRGTAGVRPVNLGCAIRPSSDHLRHNSQHNVGSSAVLLVPLSGGYHGAAAAGVSACAVRCPPSHRIMCCRRHRPAPAASSWAEHCLLATWPPCCLPAGVARRSAYGDSRISCCVPASTTAGLRWRRASGFGSCRSPPLTTYGCVRSARPAQSLSKQTMRRLQAPYSQ
jgi:hypothetical protein